MYVCPIFVRPGDLEKMAERIILCHFLFLFTHAKQASSLHLLVHFMFVEAILLLSTSPSYDQIKKWLDKSSQTGIESFLHDKYQSKTSVTFITVLFANFVEGSARTQHSPVKITSLKGAQNLECCTRFGLLAVLCTAPVFQPSFLRIHLIVFQRYFSVKSQLKYLYNYKSRKLFFACISSLMVLKVLDQLGIYRWKTDRMGTEQNGQRTGMERVQNGWNGYGKDTERELEHVWNGNRTRSVKRSLLGFF